MALPISMSGLMMDRVGSITSSQRMPTPDGHRSIAARSSAIERCPSIGDLAVEPSIATLPDEASEVLWQATLALGTSGKLQAVSALENVRKEGTGET